VAIVAAGLSLYAAGCGEAQDAAPGPEAGPVESGTPAPEGASDSVDLDVPATFHTAYEWHRDFELRARARETVRAMSAADAVSHLLAIAAVHDSNWRRDDALLDVAAFRQDAAPWIEQVAALVERHPEEALTTLLRIGGDGLDHVLRATMHEEAGVRRIALDAMSHCSRTDPEILEAGVQSLSDPSQRVSIAAAHLVVVQVFATRRSLEALSVALAESEATRFATFSALGRRGDDAAAAAPAVTEVLRTADRDDRLRAAEVLEGMPSAAAASVPALHALVVSDPDDYFAVTRNIAALSPSTFVEGLRTGAVATRVAYAWSAYPSDVDSGAERAAVSRALVDLLSHSNTRLSDVATMSLRRYDDVPSDAIDPLVAIAESTAHSHGGRIAAIDVLRSMGRAGRRSLTELIDRDDVSMFIRRYTSRSLVRAR